jgi:phosphoglycerol transferase MdoB-like AlkP superfamily enzyme
MNPTMKINLRHQAWYLPALALMMSCLISTLTRFGLMVFAWSSLDHSISELLAAFLRGALGDFLFASAFAGFLLIFTSLSHTKWPTAWPFRAKRGLAVFMLCTFLLFVAISEFVFWNEFGARFNFVAVDYLLYTTEVIGNIRESYSMPAILGGMSLAAGILSLLVFRYWKLQSESSYGFFPRLGMTALGIFLFWFVGTWSLDYADQANSQNLANQELSHNGPASFLLASRENDLDFKRYYRTLPADTYQALAPAWPDVARDQPSTTPLNPQNVVIIQIESLSASFMSAYGNTDGITPHLDQLLHEGIWFSNLYATGSRTVRGLEAMSAALPPLPGESIVRQTNNKNLYTLGSMLRKKSFEPMFVYGGYGYFDNMNAYFSGNGYSIRDRNDFSKENTSFATVWGVADEMLFNEAIKQLDIDSKQGVKRFMHIMTTSNHRPYTYPEGRIDIPSKTGRNGAVKYTDWAINNFLEQASKKPWFENTLFIILADHNASVTGKTSLPPNRYLIPALFYAPKMLPARKIESMSSQIDLPPTLLAMLGIKTDGIFFGQNLFGDKLEQRAFLVNYQELGYLTPTTDGLRHLTMLGPKKRLENFSVSADGELTKVSDDRIKDEKAIAIFQRVDEVFNGGKYVSH